MNEQPDPAAEEQLDPRPWERSGLRRDLVPSGGKLTVGLSLSAVLCGVLGLVFPPLTLFGLLIAFEARAAANHDRDLLRNGFLDLDGQEIAERALDLSLAAVEVNLVAMACWVVLVPVLFFALTR